jgi:hypothetical protein
VARLGNKNSWERRRKTPKNKTPTVPEGDSAAGSAEGELAEGLAGATEAGEGLSTSELLNDSPCSITAAPRSSAPKTKKTVRRGDLASIFCLGISTTTRAPPLVTTPYRARHPSSRCVFCSCWIAHEAQSAKASVIYRAASRCESRGNEPANA